VSMGTASLHDALVEWVADRRAVCAGASTVSYGSIAHILSAYLGAVRVDRVTTSRLEDWRNDMAARMSPRSVRNYVKVVRSFFAWAVRKGYCVHSPAAAVAVPRVKRVIPAWLSAADTERLLNLVAGAPDEVRLVVLLAVRAGLRRGEIRALRWDDVDLHNGMLRINETKSSIPRMVPMHPAVRACLDAWPRVGAYVFPAIRRHGETRGGCRGTAQGKMVNAWLARTDCGVTMHGLRHSFASQLAERGASEAEIRDLLGHTSVEITRLYTHSREALRREHVMGL